MNANDKVAVTLEIQQWQVVLNVLGKVPYENIADLIHTIAPQLQQQPRDNVVPMGAAE